MPTPSEVPVAPAAPGIAVANLGAGRERRLHPLSWLFVLLEQLREFAFPLIALLFFGRGGGAFWEWLGLGGALLLTLTAVLRYYTYRFRIDAGELVVRSGLLHRNARHIPLARIQNVVLRRNLLHRLFGVAEVKLESAVGGASAEAQMRVLSLRDAHALEVLVRANAADRVGLGGADDAGEREPERGELLLQLAPGELLKLGLTSNRGTLIAAAGAGVVSQFFPAEAGFGWRQQIGEWSRWAFGLARDLHLGWLQWALTAFVVVVLALLLVRLLSIALVLLQHYGFRLHQLDRQLSIEAGLLTTLRSHAPLQKIQHWTLRDNLLQRWLQRRRLQVETAALPTANESHSLADLVPIATPWQLDALLARWLPWLDWQAIEWRPLHPQAWRRMLLLPALLTLVGCAILLFKFGPIALATLLLLPWWLLVARRSAGHSQWALTERALLWRSGWLDRRLSFAEIGKLQGLQLLQSPFDRRRGMASVVADTAGAHPLGHRLELHYLAESEARELYRQLGQRLAGSRLDW